ncbi:transporter substrate-binding domain-containing protein [uncultured Sulfitobacter sp.]|uniref:ATP-binding protein n=1 Tax=uncultured Sulfitobacter sp. TaxID=191468 RepID=UPI002605BC06|nr:transporter substrate-binding domain-containing protein [uncultured Sulfitobacter sp.]
MSFFLRFALATFVLLTASFAGCVLSAQQLGDSPVLRAVYGDFYPYSFTDSEGDAQGYSIDIIKDLAKPLGYDIQFVSAENPKQFLAMLAQGDVDLTVFLALTPERRAAGLATASLGAYVLSAYVRQDSKKTSVEALSGKRIGVVIGAISQSAAELLPGVALVEYQTSDTLLLALLRGEVDAVVSVSETFDERLRASFVEDKVRRLSPPLAVTPYGIIIRRELPEVHAAFERAIKQRVSPEKLTAVRTLWFGVDRSIVQHPWFGNVAMIVGGIALTTVALGIYTIRLRRRSAVLASESSANQLLIDAFDQMRAAIMIFDADMKAVHWNSGFVARFPELVPRLKSGATLSQVWVDFYQSGLLVNDLAPVGIAEFTQKMATTLREGRSDQRIVHTRQGCSFDLSIFPLGTRYYAAIWVDVSVLHQQQKQLADQRSELVRKNQQLLAFSAMAAHDLKAPLAQQKMLFEFIIEDLLEAQMPLPLDAQHNFDTLCDLSGRMSLLVSDLLDYAKADSDQAPSRCFVPNERLEDIVKMAAPREAMRIVITPDMPAVKVEPTCFDMVMRNLITNAAKHHDKRKGTITIRGYINQGQVVIDVEDDGPGISPADQERVFEPFSRLTQTEGTGLGLAFVQRTVAAWGGEITLRSAPVRGCIFSITLPPDTVEAAVVLPSVA